MKRQPRLTDRGTVTSSRDEILNAKSTLAETARRHTSFLALIAVWIIVGCGAPKPKVVVTGTQSDPVVHFQDDDAEMNAAVNKAKESVGLFIRRFQAKAKNSEDIFEVKKPFETRNRDEEHIWVEVSRYENHVFYGNVDNDPENVTGLHAGDQVQVRPDEISDWLIVTPKGREGGFTIDVIAHRTRNVNQK